MTKISENEQLCLADRLATEVDRVLDDVPSYIVEPLAAAMADYQLARRGVRTDRANAFPRDQAVTPPNPADDAELVERVAKAMHGVFSSGCTDWEQISPQSQDYWRNKTRAALQPEQPDHGIEP